MEIRYMKDLLNNVFFQASITENGEDQQTIASFSETPGIAQNRKNLENAEEATKDVETEKEIIEKSKDEVRENRNDEREEDVKDRVASNVEHTEEGSEEEPQEEASAADKDEDELAAMPEKMLLQLRFLPHRMEYGSPNAVIKSSTGSCAGCSDAADAAIIDAEISEDAPSVEDKKTQEDDDTSDDEDIDINETEDMPDMSTDAPEMKYVIGTEDIFGTDDYRAFTSGWGHLIGRWLQKAGELFLWSLKCLVVGSRYLIKTGIRVGRRIRALRKFYMFKLSEKMIEKISDEKLEKQEAVAFKYDDALALIRVAAEVLETIKATDKCVFDNEPRVENAPIEKVVSSLRHYDAECDVEKNKVSLDRTKDRRVHGKIASDLGYEKRVMPNCIRQCDIIDKHIGDDKKNLNVEAFKLADQRIRNLSDALAKDLESKKVEKGSDEHKHREEMIATYSKRVAFLVNVSQVCYGIFDIVSKDLLDIFEAYEDAVDTNK